MQTNHSSQAPRFLMIPALASIYIIWGTTHLALQVTVETLPPLLSIGSRHLSAGFVLLIIAARSNRRLPTWRECLFSAPIGLVTMGICNGMVALVGSRIGAGTITCIFATGPLFIMVLDWLLRRGSGPRFQEILSVLAGLGGVALLVGCQVNGWGQPETVWMLLLLLATMLWAGSTLWMRGKLKDSSILFNSALQMLWGGSAGLAAAWIVEDASAFSWASVSQKSLLAYAYLIVFGSLIAVTAFNFVLVHKGAMVAASHSYANPVVALLIGSLFTGERLPSLGWLGVAFILFAVIASTTGLPVRLIWIKITSCISKKVGLRNRGWQEARI